ncbi:IPT/TIG domain-containing protein [Pontibacter oryzae]|uniref:T9SS C-terminal target domain-containing protein n=1 Tax=Pontibacter oryzae TaxID=2304593 RepID=A0A399S5C8_9BACT|nr:IPT/TIG domain-containing protein [Pontibacter oryzae]RIJ37593.1 T9SS C-terminal target domain-containing protein [Pontibacter oryzae]
MTQNYSLYFIRRFLLSFFILLSLAFGVSAQTPTPAIATFDGPWAKNAEAGITATNLSADGAELSPSTFGGSAQFKATGSTVELAFKKLTVEARLRFTLKATSARSSYSTAMVVESSSSASDDDFITLGTITDQSKNEETRHTYTLPSGTQRVRFAMTQRNDANLLLDAVKIAVAPEIYSFSPGEGSFDTSVTIKGSGFTGATDVYFGGVVGTIVSNTGTELVAKVPAGAPTGKIAIATPEGTAESANEFTMAPPVVTTKFTPNLGAAGTQVTINGQYFAGATNVSFNGVSATIVSGSVTDTQLKAIVPLGATTGKISVTTPAGTGTSVANFTVSAPKLNTPAFNPTAAPVNASITLSGTGLSSVTKVTFLGADGDNTDDVDVAVAAPGASDTQLSISVPASAKTGKIKVTSANGTATSTNAFTVIPAPEFVAFSPEAGLATLGAATGTNVSITGRNLEGITTVTFANNVTVDVTGVALTDNGDGTKTFEVTVPEGAVTGTVSVTTPGGTATSAEAFVVYQTPVIASFTETARPGDIITLTGTSFTGVTNVTFLGASGDGGADDLTVTAASVTDTEITVVVPIGAVTGELSLTNDAGTGTTSALTPSEFVVDATPKIISFDPTFQKETGIITITGQNLGGLTDVTFFDGVTADVSGVTLNANPNGTQSFEIAVPTGATTGAFSVTTPAGTVTSPEDLTVVYQPDNITLAVTEGRVGDSFTITGINFTGATSVKVGGVEVDFIFVSDTEITASLVSGALTGVVSVENAAGIGSSTEDFTVLTTPLITGFTPASGTIGTTVTITGKLLSQIDAVTFGASAAIAPVSASESEVVVNVPADATTGTITVSGANGSDTSADEFTVILAPEITDFTPLSGAVGTEVTINGANFTVITAVQFNGIDATSFTVAPDGNSITAIVPADAAIGKVTVTNAAGTATSTDDFEVPAPIITALDKTEGYVGDAVTITGQFLTGASSVAFNGNAATSFIVDSDTQITAYPPANAGEGVVEVTTASGTASSNPFTFKVLSPEIADFYVGNQVDNIKEGYYNTEVTIVGQYFSGATEVRFGTITASFTPVPGEEDTKILAYVPKAILNQNINTISVTTPSGTGQSIETFKTLAPEVTAISINEGRVGDAVTITGRYFQDVEKIEFIGAEAIDVSTITPADAGTDGDGIPLKSFTVNVPTGAVTGSIVVTSLSGAGESEVFTVLAPKPLTLDPTEGRVNITTVTIGGKYFNSATSLVFLGDTGNNSDDVIVSGGDFTVVNDTTITVVVPAGAKTGPIAVTTPSGTGNSPTFTVLKPVIASLTPNQGQVGITEIIVAGQYFQDAFKLTVNGKVLNDSEFTFDNDEQIRFTVPIGASSGTGSVTVETPSGVSNSVTFTVLRPVITSITPTAGSKVGEQVTVTGRYFDDITNIRFAGSVNVLLTGITLTDAGTDVNGIPLKSFTVNVPNNARTGAVTVTTPSGTSAGYTYKVIPEITSFTATEGPFGTTITITGVAITGTQSVQFNGVPASFSNVNYNTVTAVVPSGSRTGKITLTTAGGTATSTNDFVVTSPIIDSLNPTEGKIGSTFVISGVNLRDVGKVEFGNGFSTSQFEESEDGLELTVVVPKGAGTGKVKVYTLEGPPATSSQTFTVIVPVITVSRSSLAQFEATVGEESSVQTYTVSATNLESDITIAAPARGNFMISLSESSGYISSGNLVIPNPNGDGTLAPTTIYVKYKPLDEDYHTGSIVHTATNASARVVSVTGNSTNTPLPVELASFKATLQGGNTVLTWVTASEENNSHFDIEMSMDGIAGFNKVGEVASKQTNSSVRTTYEFTHALGQESGTRYYRLKQVDLDGTSAYSKVVSVTYQAPKLVTQLLVAPNPINYNSKVYVTSEVAGEAALNLHSISGRKVYTKEIALLPGKNEVQLPVYDKLTKGMYVLTVTINGQVYQVKVLKQ